MYLYLRLADNPTGIIKGDINKGDLSYRNNQTIVRYLDYDNNQVGRRAKAVFEDDS
jgi:hypothetical protein